MAISMSLLIGQNPAKSTHLVEAEAGRPWALSAPPPLYQSIFPISSHSHIAREGATFCCLFSWAGSATWNMELLVQLLQYLWHIPGALLSALLWSMKSWTVLQAGRIITFAKRDEASASRCALCY